MKKRESESYKKAVKVALEAINGLEAEADKLSKENEMLKTEAFKDAELKRMKDEIKKLKRELKTAGRNFPVKSKSELGFAVSAEDWAKAEDWKSEHLEKNKPEELRKWSGHHFYYVFDDTPVTGFSGYVRCTCGAEFEFQKGL